MVNRNDYLLVDRKSMEAYRNACESGVIPDSFEGNEKTTDLERKRIGFYFLILKNITGIDSDEDISKMIIDTEYFAKIRGGVNNDLGVDAYYINENNKEINLFNFKYREKWKIESKFKGGETHSTLRFLNVISGEEEPSRILSDYEDAEYTIKVLEKIDKYREQEEYASINLYFISNEVNPLDNREKKRLEDMYELTVKPVALGDISDLLVRVKKDISAKLKIRREKVMTYRESDDSSDTSYVFNIPLLELARITSKDEDVRNDLKEHNVVEFSDDDCVEELKFIELEPALLHDNVRGFLGKTNFNAGIIGTIEKDPRKFFMFNNGITITAEDIKNNPRDGVPTTVLKLVNYQVVNGGQTLKSVHKFIEENVDKDPYGVVSSLREASVLVRAYSVGASDEDDEDVHANGKAYSVGTQIARFTNSQNAINPADLHSNDAWQIKIKKYLDGKQYEYILKRSHVSKTKKNGKRSVSMELVAQILMAIIKEEPGKASNQKRKLFTDFYEDIFDCSTEFDKIKELLDKYFMVMEYYESQTDENGKKLGKSVQRDLYTLYIMEKTGIKDISEAEKVLDNAFAAFMTGVDIAKYRRLAYAKFKDAVDEQIASL